MECLIVGSLDPHSFHFLYSGQEGGDVVKAEFVITACRAITQDDWDAMGMTNAHKLCHQKTNLYHAYRKCQAIGDAYVAYHD